MKQDHKSINPHQLYRIPQEGVISGVCAGIAHYFDMQVSLVRIIAILGLFFFSPLFFSGYLIMSFILPKKPSDTHLSSDEEEFWRGVSLRPREKLKEIKYRLYSLNNRIQKMEDYVTSSEFEWERKSRQ